MTQYTYYPDIFVQPTVADAKAIILTPEMELSTDERWIAETDWLLNHMPLDAGLTVDYGCGIGRLAKAFANPMLGVDISPSMRNMAEVYVDKPGFSAIQPDTLRHLVEHGLRVRNVLAVWVLQHIPQPKAVIDLIYRALAPNGKFWVMNREERIIPVIVEGNLVWMDDCYSIKNALRAFKLVSDVAIPPELCAAGAYLRCYEKP